VVERNSEQLARILRQCLEEGRSVEIDGLGVFQLAPDGAYKFVAHSGPKVFLAYVQEDFSAVERLFEGFHARGFDPWLDRRKLLPGQNWPRAIEQAIEVSDFFVACFSKRAVQKRGQFQSELRYALDCANRMPIDQIFLIPVRLDDCPVPARISQAIQYVDLFPDWDKGFRRILVAMRQQKKFHLSGKLRLAG
jgi:hypothetical protein